MLAHVINITLVALPGRGSRQYHRKQEWGIAGFGCWTDGRLVPLLQAAVQAPAWLDRAAASGFAVAWPRREDPASAEPLALHESGVWPPLLRS